MRRTSILLTAFIAPAAALAPTPVDAGGTTGACQLSDAMKISELMPNASGSDDDKEWVELYNDDSYTMDLTGWSIQWSTSSPTSRTSREIPAGTSIVDEEFLVLGGVKMAGGSPDVVLDLVMGNGSGGDGVYLVDCMGTVVDAVVYGGENSQGMYDESGKTATSWAELTGDDESVARYFAYEDSDESGEDFCVSTNPTPGGVNDCDPGGGDDTGDDTGDPTPSDCPLFSDVVINEFLPNPDGDDGGYEWVELMNTSGAPLSLDGYGIESIKSSSVTSTDLPDGLTVPPGGYFLLGEEDVKGADAVIAVDFGQGSDGDGVYLIDPDGCPVDAVIYSSDDSNSDDILKEDGSIADTWVAGGDSGLSIARIVNGVDTNDSYADFASVKDQTPGEANPYIEPPVCATGGNLVINELLPNPDGDDGDNEYVELYNVGPGVAQLEGWTIEIAGSDDWNPDSPNIDYTFPSGAQLPAGSFLLVGGENVTGVDHIAGSLSLGNGSGGDGVRLVDCEGGIVDTVVYGGENSDGITDDGGGTAVSVAPESGSGEALARRFDGEDTDNSGADFWSTSEQTPGAPNPAPPVCSLDGVDIIKLNEFVPNPEGGDEGLEWVELVNTGGATVRLDGWLIRAATSEWKDDDEYTFPAEVEIAPGEFIVVGGEDVPEQQYLAEGISLGNGSDGDGLRLVDCEGNTVDTVIYSSSGLNDDELEDDLGAIAGTVATMPDENTSLGRYPDGEDTEDHGEDWVVYGTPTPGAANDAPSTGGGGGDLPSGCGKDQAGSPVDGGCATIPLPIGLPWLAVMLVAWRRRD